MKKLVALLMAVMMITSISAVVLAEEAVVEAPEFNGATLFGVEVKELNGITLMPLREVAEGFGYTVEWNDEDWSIKLIRGALYITMEIGEDGYAFSRMAHRPLGSAPVLIDNKTYVPMAFLTDFLGGYATAEEDGTYKVVCPSIVTVKEIMEDGALLVEDKARGEVVVYIDENTKVLAGDLELKTEDFKKEIMEGMILRVEYDVAMTMSIPPQTHAEKIIIQVLAE